MSGPIVECSFSDRLAQRYLFENIQNLDGFPREDKGQPLPKFGEWDVNDPASAEGFTVIFNKARDEKKTGGNPDSPGKGDPQVKHRVDAGKPPSKKWFCCISNPPAES